MATTKHDIRRWLDEGKAKGATHVVVVYDTFDHSDYPSFMKLYGTPEANRDKALKKIAETDMQRVMEVYALHLDWEKQLAEYRVFHWEAPLRAGWHSAEARVLLRAKFYRTMEEA